jgi:hypothetical protein
VQHYRQRRDLEAIAMLALERVQRGGHDVGAAANSLGEDDIGLKFEETAGGIHEIGEAAAETSAGNLIAVDA